MGKRGILIDLSRLNTISLSTDRSYASVGPSARWLDVYEQLDAEKVVVAGTRVPYVGVGGSILGGMLFLLFYAYTQIIGVSEGCVSVLICYRGLLLYRK